MPWPFVVSGEIGAGHRDNEGGAVRLVEPAVVRAVGEELENKCRSEL